MSEKFDTSSHDMGTKDVPDLFTTSTSCQLHASNRLIGVVLSDHWVLGITACISKQADYPTAHPREYDASGSRVIQLSHV